MKKLKLELDALAVESFEAAPGGAGAGTVRGNAEAEATGCYPTCTVCPDNTCGTGCWPTCMYDCTSPLNTCAGDPEAAA